MKKILFGISMFVLFFFAISLSGCGEKACEHVEEVVAGKAATCTETGLTDGKKCSVCQEILVAQEEIAVLGHTEEVVEGKAATCIEPGLTNGKKCSVCGVTTVAQEEIAVLAHTEETVAAKAATCTEAGIVAHTHCSVCDKNFDAEGNELTTVVIAALGHSEETVEAKAATCTEAGNVAHTHCSVCDKNFDAEGNELDSVEIAALGHKFIDSLCHCGEEYVVSASGWTLVTKLNDGDKVLIGAPAYGKLLSAEKVSAGSFYNKGVNYSTENFANVTDAEIFVVTANEDGTYTFTSLTGKVIAMADSYSSLNDAGEHKSWKLEPKGEGLFLMKNTGRGNYLEWYNSKGNWSTYTSPTTKEYELSFYIYVEPTHTEHVHNHISDVHNVTCTEDGYTTYTCSCGDTYTVEGEKAQGHKYSSEVTAPTCTVDGYTTFTCSCGDSYTEDGEKAEGHKYVDGKCSCGEEDPDAHVHSYTTNVTAPTCVDAGLITYTCACGDTYTEVGEAATGVHTEEVIPAVAQTCYKTGLTEGKKCSVCDEILLAQEVIDKNVHLDENNDIYCDRDGCTGYKAPAADSTLSLTNANTMKNLSTSSKYYVEGTVHEILNVPSGIFTIIDEEGVTFIIRMPKDEAGNAYTTFGYRVVVGDKVKVYGNIKKMTAHNSAGGIEGGLIVELKHEHSFSEATCTEPSSCACLVLGDPALGHIDENTDNSCDRCSWNMKLKVSNIVIATDPTKANGVQTPGSDGKTVSWTWSDDNFDAIIAKGTSTVTVYTTAKAYMQLKKQNTFTLTNKISASIKTITISVTSASYLTSLEAVLKTAGLTFTKDEAAFTATIEWNKTEDFTFSNTGSSTIYISGVEVVYEK